MPACNLMTFKRCPKCDGNIVIELDGGVLLEWCLQCGYNNYIKKGAPYSKAKQLALNGQR
ncbi:hypothetical protein ACFLYS_01705 [Chloroflexota bacterium]